MPQWNWDLALGIAVGGMLLAAIVAWVPDLIQRRRERADKHREAVREAAGILAPDNERPQ